MESVVNELVAIKLNPILIGIIILIIIAFIILVLRKKRK